MAPLRARLRLTLAAGLLGACVLAQAQGSQQEPADLKLPKIEILLPLQENLSFRGMFSADQLGTPQGAMVYPGYGGLAGLIGGILAHGAIVESEKQRQRTEAEKAADRVLEPLQDVLSSFSHKSLLNQAIEMSSIKHRARTVAPGANESGAWLLDSAPVIWLSQDQLSLLADMHVSVQKAPGQEIWKARVRVASEPLSTQDPAAHWTADSGQALRQATARLLARALEIGVEYAQIEPQSLSQIPFQTVRFHLGGSKRTERAQVLRSDCEYRLLKTLRGELYAVPSPLMAGDEDSKEGCAAGKPAATVAVTKPA